MLVEDITEQTTPGVFRQKVAYSEATNIKKVLLSRGYNNEEDKWQFNDTNGNHGIYNIGDGEFVLTLKA